MGIFDSMNLSGFTFLRNTSKLYYPILESILSVLPLVDEFVIALGKGDEDDDSEQKILSLNSSKIKIIHTEWDLNKYTDGTEYAHQTDIAKAACSGDWLLYMQGDELIHENDYDEITSKCKRFLNDKTVDGFLFSYYHFYGNYDHYFRNHCWYPYEIRIIRNDPDIHSYRDAQSFRRMPSFDGFSYTKKENTFKLNVVKLNASVYHYGWVRPPHLMQKKRVYFAHAYIKDLSTHPDYKKYQHTYDYGRIDRCKKFTGTHPKLMASKIKTLNWQDSLRFSGPKAIGRLITKHERLKYRIIIWIENTFFGGRIIGGQKNYKLTRGKD